jgi:hypothetical protein
VVEMRNEKNIGVNGDRVMPKVVTRTMRDKVEAREAKGRDGGRLHM